MTLIELLSKRSPPQFVEVTTTLLARVSQVATGGVEALLDLETSGYIERLKKGQKLQSRNRTKAI